MEYLSKEQQKQYTGKIPLTAPLNTRAIVRNIAACQK